MSTAIALSEMKITHKATWELSSTLEDRPTWPVRNMGAIFAQDEKIYLGTKNSCKVPYV